MAGSRELQLDMRRVIGRLRDPENEGLIRLNLIYPKFARLLST
jgi:hypothetical protein